MDWPLELRYYYRDSLVCGKCVQLAHTISLINLPGSISSQNSQTEKALELWRSREQLCLKMLALFLFGPVFIQ